MGYEIRERLMSKSVQILILPIDTKYSSLWLPANVEDDDVQKYFFISILGG